MKNKQLKAEIARLNKRNKHLNAEIASLTNELESKDAQIISHYKHLVDNNVAAKKAEEAARLAVEEVKSELYLARVMFDDQLMKQKERYENTDYGKIYKKKRKQCLVLSQQLKTSQAKVMALMVDNKDLTDLLCTGASIKRELKSFFKKIFTLKN